MPSEFRDPKTLPDWIEQDYFRRRRGLWRWRWRLTWGALLVCAVVMVATSFSRKARPMYEAGPVAQAHAMFDCADCHGSHWRTALRFLPWDASASSVPDESCTKCHDGPPHSDRQLADQVQHCAGCHREHRGRVALTRVPDSECTACHAHIGEHTQGGKSALADVPRFPDGHPQYTKRHAPVASSIALSFPHDKHLVQGGVLMPGGGRKQLECSDCHKPDEAGRFMRPVKYEDHCATCHPLGVRLAGEMKGAALEKAAEEFAKLPAPHRAPREVRADLRDRLLSLMNKYKPEPAAGAENLLAPLEPREGTGARQVWQPSERERAEAEKLAFVVAQMGPVEKKLLGPGGVCASCHGAPAPGPDGLPDFPPVHTKAPPAGGRFVHETHRMLACEQCHAVRTSSKLADPALMPEVTTCAECHKPSAGARSDCVECHGYHQYGPGGKAHKGLTIPQALGK